MGNLLRRNVISPRGDGRSNASNPFGTHTVATGGQIGSHREIGRETLAPGGAPGHGLSFKAADAEELRVA